MIQRRTRVTAGLYLAGDLLATAAAFFLAWVLRFELEVIPVVKGTPDFDRYLLLLPVILLLWPLVFYFHGLYQSRRGRSRVEETMTIVLAVALAALLLSGLSAWYRPPLEPGSPEYFTYSRAFLAFFAILCVAFVFASRMGIRSVLRHVRSRGHNLQRILVVGAGALGQEITQKILAHRELGFEVVGFLDDDPGKQGRSFFGVPVLGPTDRIEEALAAHGVHQVFIALPLEAHRKSLALLRRVGQEYVEVKMVPDILQYAALKAGMEDLDGTPVINLTQVPLQGWNSLVKRALDVALAGAGLLALAPAFAVIAWQIRRHDGGPVFYRQERMGLDGKRFQMLKFRSMRVDAEAESGPVWPRPDDERRTPIGRALRRWSLDELPQLWNVLKGEMSLVGPRPERPPFVEEFKQKVPQYMLRHRVKAGMTGWAQVHGWRGNTSIRKRIQYDLYYIQNWSLRLDLKILWMTLRHGLRTNAH